MFGQIESASYFQQNAVKFTRVNRKLKERINRKFAFLNNKSSIISTLDEGTTFFPKIHKGKLSVTYFLIGALKKKKIINGEWLPYEHLFKSIEYQMAGKHWTQAVNSQ